MKLPFPYRSDMEYCTTVAAGAKSQANEILKTRGKQTSEKSRMIRRLRLTLRIRQLLAQTLE
ncbi:hypothetical protein FQZ97_751900 [compost metagenome]